MFDNLTDSGTSLGQPLEKMETAVEARVGHLRKLGLLNGPPVEAFDQIVRMAAQLFAVPQAAISFVDTDRVWFRSRIGIAQPSVVCPRAPCTRVADTNELLVIPDLQQDAYFRHSVLAASGVRFYAGAPLITREGYALGSICVSDLQPRQISDMQRQTLRDLAGMVMAQIELQHSLGRIDPVSGLANRTQLLDDLVDLERESPPGLPRLVGLVHLANTNQLANAARVMNACYLDELASHAIASLRAVLPAATRMYQVARGQFGLIMPPALAEGDACAMLQAWLHRRGAWSRSRFLTTPAIGLVPFEPGATDPPDVLRMAEGAVQDAFACKSRVAMYSVAQDVAYRRRFLLLNEFGRALAHPRQLRLVFQPRIDLATGACVGAEALLRWRHPALGDVSPAEFMPIVEQTSMSGSTTAWVIDMVLRQVSAWRAQGIVLPVSANLSAPNLLDPGFAADVLAMLERHALDAGALELEITESAAMENLALAQETLGQLCAAGLRVAIDDFGTGYSSLSYLQNIPAQVLKIDQGFIRGMEDDDRKRSLVDTVIKLAHNLGHHVVAEGVETASASTWLRQLGCDEAQGYLYSRPLEADAFPAWLRQHGGRAGRSAFDRIEPASAGA